MRKRIAVMLDMFDAKYQAELVRQLRIACEQRRAELLVFPGGGLEAELRGGTRRRAVFDLVSSASVDGVVLLSSCLSTNVGLGPLQEFCKKFSDLALCSIGDPIPGVPSLLVDNEHGTRLVLRHMLEDHGYRRIGLIRGPLGSNEADIRHRTCCAELAAHGIEPDPALVAVGDFLTESGRRGMEAFLDQPGEPVQAVIAANDYMALGALAALAARGNNLRHPVGVAGFDNIDESNFSTPPLTTVEQPLTELAASAVRCILAQLQGDAVPTESTLQAALVIRRSCGCLAHAHDEPRIPQTGKESSSVAVKFALRREALMADLSRASRGYFRGVKSWEGILIGALIDDLRGVPGNVFMAATERMLRGLATGESDAWRFHDVITALRAGSLAILAEHATERAHAENLFHLAHRMTGEAVVRVQAGGRLSMERVWSDLNDLGTALAQCASEASFTRTLDRELPRLGVKQAFVARYRDAGVPRGPRRASLLYCLDPALHFSKTDQEPYPAHELLPARIWRDAPSLSWVVVPLFFRNREQGFALLDLKLDDGSFYEAIRLHLCVALDGFETVWT